MKNIIANISKIIMRKKLLNSEKNKGCVFNASELTIEEMKALLV